MKRFLTLFSVLWAALGSAQTTVSFEKIFFETHSREQKYNIQGASITGGKLFQLHDGNKPIVVYDMKDGALSKMQITRNMLVRHLRPLMC